jgi:hypothetical protein
MDGHPRQNPAYRPATEKPRSRGFSIPAATSSPESSDRDDARRLETVDPLPMRNRPLSIAAATARLLPLAGLGVLAAVAVSSCGGGDGSALATLTGVTQTAPTVSLPSRTAAATTDISTPIDSAATGPPTVTDAPETAAPPPETSAPPVTPAVTVTATAPVVTETAPIVTETAPAATVTVTTSETVEAAAPTTAPTDTDSGVTPAAAAAAAAVAADEDESTDWGWVAFAVLAVAVVAVGVVWWIRRRRSGTAGVA